VIKVSPSEALLLTAVAREVANILRTERGTIHASEQVKKLWFHPPYTGIYCLDMQEGGCKEIQASTARLK